jgi:hypothetical protein
MESQRRITAERDNHMNLNEDAKSIAKDGPNLNIMLYALAEEDREAFSGIKIMTNKAVESKEYDKFADS